MSKLIVLEGTDGSGKGTQTQALRTELEAGGHRVATLSFPRYGNVSAQYVARYLNGEYGDAASLDPFVTSLFFAIDRRESKGELEALVAAHDVVILDRYVDSNAGHQGSKIDDEAERAVFLDWLYHTEFEVFGVPKPDLVIVLHVPAEVSYKLIAKKAERDYIKTGKRDAHESNREHLRRAEAAYLWLVNTHPKTHRLLSCTGESGALLAPEIITGRIIDLLAAEGIAIQNVS